MQDLHWLPKTVGISWCSCFSSPMPQQHLRYQWHSTRFYGPIVGSAITKPCTMAGLFWTVQYWSAHETLANLLHAAAYGIVRGLGHGWPQMKQQSMGLPRGFSCRTPSSAVLLWSCSVTRAALFCTRMSCWQSHFVLLTKYSWEKEPGRDPMRTLLARAFDLYSWLLRSQVGIWTSAAQILQQPCQLQSPPLANPCHPYCPWCWLYPLKASSTGRKRCHWGQRLPFVSVWRPLSRWVAASTMFWRLSIYSIKSMSKSKPVQTRKVVQYRPV